MALAPQREPFSSGDSALRESNQFNRQIIDSVAEGVIVCGVDLRYLVWNPFMQRLTGLAESEVVGKHPLELFPFLRDTGAYARFERALAGETLPPLDFPYAVPATGRTGWTSETCSPLKDTRGAIIGIISTVRDITDRKLAEAMVVEAREAAERASKAKSQFLSNMSHELRTPMNGVLGMIELVLGGGLEASQREFLTIAASSGRGLVQVFDDILSLTSLEAHTLRLKPETFAVRDCVLATVALVQSEAVRKGLRLETVIADDVPRTVVADRARAQQVLMNLVGNAVKFTDRGRVDVRVSRREGQLRCEVADTGIGIAPDKLPLLFKPFTQVDESNVRGHGGAGLGLVIARQLAELMGGRVDVDSSPGRGSTFTFTLPA